MKKWLIALMMAAGAATCSAAEVKNDDGVNIYFARHGKTLLNTFDRVQGWADSPLPKTAFASPVISARGLKVFRLIASIPAMPDVSVKPCR